MFLSMLQTNVPCVLDVYEGCCKCFNADVEKVDLDVSILRDTTNVFLDVSNVVFECCEISY
jgi:hypothetical protein